MNKVETSYIENCPLCGSVEFKILTRVGDDRHSSEDMFNICTCDKCNHVFSDFILNETKVSSFYSRTYSKKLRGLLTNFYYKLRNAIFNSKFFVLWLKYDGDQYFLKYGKKERCKFLLDYGCYEGRQLLLFKGLGYQVEGYEVNPKAASVARNKKFNVYQYGEMSAIKEKYDVVVMSHVIEHLANPKESLELIKRVLKKDGVLRISCPNYESYYRRIFKTNWSNWHVPFHLHHFRMQILKELLGSSGFVYVRSSTVTPSHGISISILNILGFKVDQSHKNPILIIPVMLFCSFILKPLTIFFNRLGFGDVILIEVKK